MPKTAKFITNLWLYRFKQELEDLENGPNTPFTQLQKESVISQIDDLQKQLEDLKNDTSENEVSSWPDWKKGSPGNVRLDVSKNTTPPALEQEI